MMNKTFIYCVLVVLMSYTQTGGGQNSTSEEQDSGFLGFLASLRRKDWDVVYGEGHFCAGALISAYIVLAAAHCFGPTTFYDTEPDPQNIRVIVGAMILTKKSYTDRDMNVKEYVVHENYIQGLDKDDIAIVVLTRYIAEGEVFKVGRVYNAPLPIGTACKLMGWKHINKDSRVALFHIMSVEKTEDTNFEDFDPSKQITIRNMGTATEHCLLLNGGLLTRSGFLVGIATLSCGPCLLEDGDLKCYAIFTNVFGHLDWIHDTIEKIGRAGGHCFVGNRIYLVILFNTVYKMSF